MKIKITDYKKFFKHTSFGENYPREYGFNGFELDVFAIAVEDGFLKKKVQLLIFIYGFLKWIPLNKKWIEIVDDSLDESWIYTPLFSYYSKEYMEKIKLTNLSCSAWMIEDETFFFDIIENSGIAVDKFKKYYPGIELQIEDSRLTGQEKYMMGITLKKVNIQNYLTQNHINDQEWYKRCEFCMDKINLQCKEDCYTSKDYYIWVCPNCFRDFKNHFHWTIEEPNKKV